MSEVYPVFTVASGNVTKGAKVEDVSISHGTISIAAIVVGEEGRGRARGLLPVTGLQKMGAGYPLIMNAEVGLTKSGKPKLYGKFQPTTNEKAIVVFLTKMGYRGGNSHTGDRGEVKYSFTWAGREKVGNTGVPLYGSFGQEEKERLVEKFHLTDSDFEFELSFTPFPGEVICEGSIAEGAAGRMGSGQQLVAVMPKGVVFRTGYSGRLYGGPKAHYYQFDGKEIVSLTWEERETTDLF